MRDKWTDERLDDLNKKVDDGFRRVDERFVHLERTMWQGFAWLVGLQVTFFVATIGFIAAQT